jgi:ABC-2 type transport system ATP-binding protein
LRYSACAWGHFLSNKPVSDPGEGICLKISISNLEMRYRGGKRALREVNLEISAGMFGLLGPNGAGKTTLMRILVTMLRPTYGSVLVDGKDIHRHRRSIRRLLGYLPQEFTLFSRFRTWEFLDYMAALGGIRSHSKRMDKVEKMLEGVGLLEARDRRVSKLSGGMKRRLGIAQTLITDPRIIVVDEPTVGLDPEERLRFRNLLADLARHDIIIILSTHIVGDISSTCSDMALLNHGKIVFNGSPQQLIDAARGQVWQVTASDYELDQLRESYPVISTVPAERGYEVRVVGKAIDKLPAVNVDPNLEDAYICFMQTQSDNGNILSQADAW